MDKITNNKKELILIWKALNGNINLRKYGQQCHQRQGSKHVTSQRKRMDEYKQKQERSADQHQPHQQTTSPAATTPTSPINQCQNSNI